MAKRADHSGPHEARHEKINPVDSPRGAANPEPEMRVHCSDDAFSAECNVVEDLAIPSLPHTPEDV